MPNDEIKISVLELKDLLINPKEKGTNQILCTCPFCNKEDHFYVNKNNLLFDCKKCKEYGNGFKLLSHLGVLNDYIHRSLNLKSLVKLNLGGMNSEDEALEILPDQKPPIGFKRIYDNKYLKDRGFTTQDFYKYKIGVCDIQPRLRDYVIFLIEDEGRCKGFISRCSLNKKDMEERGLIRYRNLKGVKFNSLLFGFDEIKRMTQTVIIVEGMFDKIRLDRILNVDDSDELKVICTYGNKVTDNQLKKLKTTNIQKIILFYDLDAINEMKTTTSKMKPYFDLEVACLLDGKDPGEAPVEDIFDALYNTMSPNTFFYEKCNGRKIKF